LTGTGTPERDDGGLPPLLTASDDGLQVVGLLRGPGT